MSVLSEIDSQKTELAILASTMPEGEEKSALEAKIDDLIDARAVYIAAQVDEATQLYADALAALQAANAEITAAKDDLGRTAEVINKVARAIGLVQQLVSTIA